MGSTGVDCRLKRFAIDWNIEKSYIVPRRTTTNTIQNGEKNITGPQIIYGYAPKIVSNFQLLGCV